MDIVVVPSVVTTKLARYPFHVELRYPWKPLDGITNSSDPPSRNDVFHGIRFKELYVARIFVHGITMCMQPTVWYLIYHDNPLHGLMFSMDSTSRNGIQYGSV